ncbi:hypothetical protein ACFPK9_01125 [Rubritalea spongiae]|uniref:Uncharacterized protein n=1 Tax=Rubritalea spongiae TaxID=430797 RepID=A0ABW5E2D9_9BACT
MKIKVLLLCVSAVMNLLCSADEVTETHAKVVKDMAELVTPMTERWKKMEIALQQVETLDLESIFGEEESSVLARKAFESRLRLARTRLLIMHSLGSAIQAYGLVMDDPRRYNTAKVLIDEVLEMHDENIMSLLSANHLERAYRVNYEHADSEYVKTLQYAEARFDEVLEGFEEIEPPMIELLKAANQ